MSSDKLSKILGVILLICGGIVLIEPVTTGKIDDLFVPLMFIAFGIYSIFKNPVGRIKK